MLQKEKWKWRNLQIWTWWILDVNDNIKLLLTSPWAFSVIKSLNKFLARDDNGNIKIQLKYTQQWCEIEKSLKHHGWVMGHGWRSHGVKT